MKFTRRAALFVSVVALIAATLAAPAGAHGGNSGQGNGGHQDGAGVAGFVRTKSNKSFEDTWDALLAEIPPQLVITTVDHAANAAGAGLTLLPTREVFFGNPNLGTPLMQSSQNTGIDLPQKIAVWENSKGKVWVGYNSPDYLVARHDIDPNLPQLDTIATVLASFASAATGRHVNGNPPNVNRIDEGEGLVFVPTNKSATEAFDALRGVITAAPPNILFELEHDVNAANAELMLDPTKLLVFGAPPLGTPLMNENQSIAIDLPQKMLVIEDGAGDTFIVYNDPLYIADRHGIDDDLPQLAAIAGALANFANMAAS